MAVEQFPKGHSNLTYLLRVGGSELVLRRPPKGAKQIKAGHDMRRDPVPALAQLSVFEGGFTLDAAEAVLDLGAHSEAPWPPDAVQSLVDKSLVRVGAGERFDLLVSIKEYAAEQLGAPGRFCGSGRDALRAAQARHVEYENSAADVALGAKPVEVDGVAKPTAARVAALARAGQTLLTADAARALRIHQRILLGLR